MSAQLIQAFDEELQPSTSNKGTFLLLWKLLVYGPY